MRKHVLPAFALCVLALSSTAWARKAKNRYYVDVTAVEAGDGVPKDIPDRVKAKLAEVLSKRKEFVATLDGAPDPAQTDAFKKWLKKSKIKAFNVTVKVTDYERELLPPKEGKKGQILRVHIGVSLVGTSKPDEGLALGGDGMASVATEIGKVVRPADDAFASDSAMSEALAAAVDDAVQALNAGPNAKPQKK